jgi:ankyrin repeat protein
MTLAVLQFATRALAVLLLLSAAATVEGPAAAEADGCATLASKMQQQKPDTQLQRNIALISAAADGCTGLVDSLLAGGASVEAANRFGTTALGQAARAGHVAVVDLLLDRGAAIDAHNVAGSTPLYIAAESNRGDVAQRLLERGADANLAGRGGVTPLAAAAYNGNSEIVGLLLAHHADPDARDRTGKAPIIYAAAKGYVSIVQRLLDAGVDAKERYGNELTALMWAAGYADGTNPVDAARVAGLLLDRGAALDAADNRGRTALMIASEAGHLAIVELLIARGADRTLRDKSGKNAADFAASEAVRDRLLAR